jgi:diguanylate cyclase (GGDEF)-like protein
MKTSLNIYARIGLAIASLAAQSGLFIILYPTAGLGIAAFMIFPLAVIGWMLGIRGSLLFGALTLPLNLFLLQVVNDFYAGNLIANVTASFAFTLIGMLVGYVKELLNRLNRQAEDLHKERENLQEEIKKRITAEQHSSYEALHDPLTGLPNRRLFIDRLEHAIEWKKRHPDHRFAVLYLDFDRFKIINDSLGHSTGDQLLVRMAHRLRASVRTLDTVARLGGDEFAILLEAYNNDEEVFTIVTRLQASVTAPLELSGNSIVMTASIGIVMNLDRSEQMDDIMRDADIAMYRAKESGKNRFEVFHAGMRDEADVTLKLEGGLRSALDNDELRLHYQPILSLKTRRIVGFEALLRWQHPQRGLLYPTDFLKTAEETGLMLPIGQWVLHQACTQMQQWQTRFRTEPPLTMSVNLSARQFAQPNLPGQIEQVLKATGLPAASLMLELTETTVLDDVEAAVTRIKQLQSLGVGVDIDDFGAGYSSLGYLNQLPVNHLKIDRSFISALGVSKSGLPIIRAIIALAASLDMQVIAEGIETVGQMDKLIALECEYGQGYLFNTPIDGEAAQALLHETFGRQAA